MAFRLSFLSVGQVLLALLLRLRLVPLAPRRLGPCFG